MTILYPYLSMTTAAISIILLLSFIVKERNRYDYLLERIIIIKTIASNEKTIAMDST